MALDSVRNEVGGHPHDEYLVAALQTGLGEGVDWHAWDGPGSPKVDFHWLELRDRFGLWLSRIN